MPALGLQPLGVSVGGNRERRVWPRVGVELEGAGSLSPGQGGGIGHPGPASWPGETGDWGPVLGGGVKVRKAWEPGWPQAGKQQGHWGGVWIWPCTGLNVKKVEGLGGPGLRSTE